MKVKIKVVEKELHAKHEKHIQNVNAYYLWPIPKLGLIKAQLSSADMDSF
jgi:hypothetical protein